MNYKAGFVALLGLPNAGKSTLANCLVGEKISIVTNKPQTTRRRISAIVTEKNFQAILVDAPGVIAGETGLNQFLSAELSDVINTSDSILAILNLDSKNPEPLEEIIEMAKKSKKKWAALITKTDLGHANRVETLRAKLEVLGVPFAEISAQAEPKETCQKVLPLLRDLLPESPAPLYDNEILTTEKIRDICSEIVREKCFEFLFEEIPYQLAVQVRSFEELPRLVKIYADILVEKDNQRKIVVGQGAQNLKRIGTEARLDIEKLIDKKVYLDLHVKIKKKWTKDPLALKELGYVVQL